jgi:hypothetical protein
MPTGYTADLHDGKQITFEQFVLKCSRAMGAAIMQRDESPDVEIRERTLDDHYVENVAKSAAKLQEALNRPASEWEALQDAAIAEAETHRAKYLADKEAMKARYEGMLEQVRAWVPARTSADIYAQQEIARLTKAHGREIQYLAEERERVAGQNAWVRALRDSLAR